MTLYKKKYRIETNRFQNHLYGKGIYFVTICAKKKMQWFGEVKQKRMILSGLGTRVEDCIRAIPQHFPHVKVEAFVVMPNHIHILMRVAPAVETRDSRVSTKEASPHNNPAKKFTLQPKGLGSIVNQLKGVVTKHSRAAGFSEFQWQSRYHDRMIRSDTELATVKKYIAQNPDAWDKETVPWHADAASHSL